MADELDLDEIQERAQELRQTTESGKLWAIRQASDLRAKAEVIEEMQEHDEIPEGSPPPLDSVPGSVDEMRETAEQLEALFQQLY